MANKKITFTLEGGEQELLEGVVTFAKSHGWTEKVLDPNNPSQEIDNPITALKMSDQIIWGFISDNIKNYNANVNAAKGREQALITTEVRLSSVKSSLEIE